ncbi:MAG TPA: hypothetical protein PLE30_06100 [Candidatus Kapabacteria bacterium]|nr:hypothetical protein [Candidatus Kapabacteria bacterium]
MRNKILYLLSALCIIFLASHQESKSLGVKNINLDLSINLEKIINFDGKFRFNEFLEARRGGGGRGSFGRSRSSRGSSSRSSSSSSRSSSRSSASALPRNPAKSPSFGGNRISREHASAKYGVPRKTETISSKNGLGQQMNYRVNDYGGFSSSLMMGYMMGNMSWWMMAPSLLYSRPVYVENTDGSVDVYPPTFSFTKFLLLLIAIVVVVYIIKGYIRNKRAKNQIRDRSSFI